LVNEVPIIPFGGIFILEDGPHLPNMLLKTLARAGKQDVLKLTPSPPLPFSKRCSNLIMKISS